MKQGMIIKSLGEIIASHYVFPTNFTLKSKVGQDITVHGSDVYPDILAILGYATMNLLSASEVLKYFPKVFVLMADADHPHHDIYQLLLTYQDDELIEDIVTFEGHPIISHETIENFWQHFRKNHDSTTREQDTIALGVRDTVTLGIRRLMDELETGKLAVITEESGKWETNVLLKKAILLYFHLHENQASIGWDSLQPGAYDKVPLRFAGWNDEDFAKSELRIAPMSVIRIGVYIGHHSLIMPSFINIGAHIGESSYIGANSTIEGCVRIGKGVHISTGAVIGDKFGDMNITVPVIEDNCYIGKNATIGSGVIIRHDAIIGDGVHISGKTPVLDMNGDVRTNRGEIPANAVVMTEIIKGLPCVRIIEYRVSDASPLEVLSGIFDSAFPESIEL